MDNHGYTWIITTSENVRSIVYPRYDGINYGLLRISAKFSGWGQKCLPQRFLLQFLMDIFGFPKDKNNS
jgi:hypothetical protein